jgi:hypothetical protein
MTQEPCNPAPTTIGIQPGKPEAAAVVLPIDSDYMEAQRRLLIRLADESTTPEQINMLLDLAGFLAHHIAGVYSVLAVTGTPGRTRY